MNADSSGSISQIVLGLIADHPGITRARLQKELQVLDVNLDTVLSKLEIEGKISKTIEDSLPCYYTVKKPRKKRRKRKEQTNEIRKNIRLLLLENPGLNLSTIAEKLDMSPQLTEYHLLYLCRNDQVISVKGKQGYYRRFFIKETGVGKQEKDLLSALRQPHLLRVILMIMKHPALSHQELADLLDLHPSTLTHHISRLNEYDIIESVSRGKEKVYRVKQRRKIMGMIRKYIFDVITDGFRDMWEEMDPRI